MSFQRMNDEERSNNVEASIHNEDRVRESIIEHQIDCGGRDQGVEESTGHDRKKNPTKTIQRETKPQTQTNHRKLPDQETIHKYARMLQDPIHKHVINALDSKLKARVLKFVRIEENLINFCKEHNSPYEKPNQESDYNRRQRMKCRIKYHVKKGYSH